MWVIKKYIYASCAALFAFIGIFLYRKGGQDQRNKLSRDKLEGMREAKDVRDEIKNDPHLSDRAKQWVKKD